jgi:hypothetical protein
MKPITHLLLVARSIIRGAIHPLPQYAFMAWCSVRAQGQLYIFLVTVQQLAMIWKHSSALDCTCKIPGFSQTINSFPLLISRRTFQSLKPAFQQLQSKQERYHQRLMFSPPQNFSLLLLVRTVACGSPCKKALPFCEMKPSPKKLPRKQGRKQGPRHLTSMSNLIKQLPKGNQK